ncbi:MAG: hypothetical protein CVU65_10120 [Deltaproteobacteria bacterium HGW-Deltaproteobacteria-22]|jgi:phosphoglycolate phosphatase-like HAD superfamily hydrolase|nr:MAG: hypothetical protein CVU65_10120 [Deltaproteobacteria bacterium HGW-Deltaproteobacteria-22]
MTTPTPPASPRLIDDARWDPLVRIRLEAFLASCARELAVAPGHDDAPFAVFDWDHTLFHGDIGDALFLHMVKNHGFFRPETWQDTSLFLTHEAVDALAGLTPRDSARLPGPGGSGLAREMVSIYLHHRTSGGAAAFSGFNPETTHPSYAWCASLLAGHTPAQVADLTHEVMVHLFNRPVGTTGELAGLHGWADWARPATPMINLATRLQAAGVPVWIVSASPQHVVETCARHVGLDPVRVIGVRSRLASDGRLLSRLETCGGHDGVIPYDLGKRCWIQRIICGRTDPCLERSDDQTRARLWFAAGDSDGDLAFLQDATRLRLVIAHRDNRAVGLATGNEDGRWLVNPPFFGA